MAGTPRGAAGGEGIHAWTATFAAPPESESESPAAARSEPPAGAATRHGGILSFWSRGAQSHFAGREGALSLGGDVRTTMFGAATSNELAPGTGQLGSV